MALSPASMLEAVLFASGEPMAKKRLATLLGVSDDLLEAGLSELAKNLHGRGLSLIDTGEQVELRTAPEAAEIVKKLRDAELSRDLGKASLETLAIILYKDGATRSDVDWVRGVNSTAALRSLLLRGLVERSEDADDRRRARYTASVDALAHLGVSTREELPHFADFQTSFANQEAAHAESEVADTA